jgi:beta-lactamase class A
MNKFFKKNYILGYAGNGRLFVIAVSIIFVLVVIIVILLNNARVERNKNPSDAAINLNSLTDPLRQFYKADDLVINIQPLRNELNKLENNQNISIYFEVLNTGANISINKDSGFFPASLLKVPLIIAVVKKIERGEWQWNTKIELTEADKNNDFGTLWQQPVGTLFTIEELVKQELVNSDNTAYFMLLNNINPTEILKVQNYLGLGDFPSENLEISAKQYSPILRSLFSATYLTIEDSEKILEWMSESDFNNYLAGGMSKDIKFSHKIGTSDEKKSYLDAGIVYLRNRPYILIVMIKNLEVKEADGLMHDISRKVYDYMMNYPKNI